MSMSDVPSKYSSAASFISGAVMRRPAKPVPSATMAAMARKRPSDG